jgi:hypothetical protein
MREIEKLLDGVANAFIIRLERTKVNESVIYTSSLVISSEDTKKNSPLSLNCFI